MPTCADISANAHSLLTHLTRTKRNTKPHPVVRGSIDEWAPALGLTAEQVRLAYEEIGPQGDEFVRTDKHGRRLLWLACDCGAAKRADLSRKVSHSQEDKSLGLTSSTGSASMILSLRDRQDVTEEGGGLTPAERFQNGAQERPTATPSARENGRTLALHFVDRVTVSASRNGIKGVSPMTIRLAALATHFKDLMAWGTSPADIRQVIDEFAADYAQWHKPGVDPGRVFLANRRRLFASHEERALYATERDIDKVLASGSHYATLDDLRRK